MIIQEMEAEVVAHEACRELHKKSGELEQRREELEDQLRFYQQRFKELTRKMDEDPAKNGGLKNPTPGGALEADRARVKRAVERIRGQLRQVDGEATATEREIAQQFHPFWGSLLKEANETSSFGDQVEEYACLYTSRVSNFLAYSPLQYFRSPRDLLPHEL
jgi:predicted  nucleic acid-binding Zn-ribbon protein